jgi:hypothetical protein
MGGFRFSFGGFREAPASPEQLHSLLDKLPEPVKKELGKGFERIGSLPPEKIEIALNELGKGFLTHPPDTAAFGKLLGTSVADAGAVAIALAIFAVTIRAVGATDFFAALAAVNIINADKARTLTALVAPLFEKHKPQLEKQIIEQEIAYEVLPNLTQAAWTVDLRPYYKDGKIQGFFPVGLLTLTTDTKEIAVSAQVSQPDFSSLFQALEAMKTRMEDLQSYAAAFEAKK